MYCLRSTIIKLSVISCVVNSYLNKKYANILCKNKTIKNKINIL